MSTGALEPRVRTLEDALRELAEQSTRTTRELAQLSLEMREFKDEMREFKDETRQQNRKMNRKWGDLANKLGTLVEDLVAPSLPRLIQETLGLEVIDLSPVVGILASLAVDDDVLRHATRDGLLVLATGDRLMEMKNPPGFGPPAVVVHSVLRSASRYRMAGALAWLAAPTEDLRNRFQGAVRGRVASRAVGQAWGMKHPIDPKIDFS